MGRYLSVFFIAVGIFISLTGAEANASCPYFLVKKAAALVLSGAVCIGGVGCWGPPPPRPTVPYPTTLKEAKDLPNVLELSFSDEKDNFSQKLFTLLKKNYSNNRISKPFVILQEVNVDGEISVVSFGLVNKITNESLWARHHPSKGFSSVISLNAKTEDSKDFANYFGKSEEFFTLVSKTESKSIYELRDADSRSSRYTIRLTVESKPSGEPEFSIEFIPGR